MGSGCMVLHEESERFVNYLLSDARLREKIVDKKSMVEALKKAFQSDPSLGNILDDIRQKGDSIDDCSEGIWQDTDLQDLVMRNKSRKKDFFRKRVRKQRPELKGKAFTKEWQRRVKISTTISHRSIKATRQVTITEATKPIKVEYSVRGKKIVYRRTTSRNLTKAEAMLIKNNLKKPLKEVIKKYYDSGLKFRTETSIKKHYYRMKKSV